MNDIPDGCIPIDSPNDLVDFMESTAGYTPRDTITALRANGPGDGDDGNFHILGIKILEEGRIGQCVDKLKDPTIHSIVFWDGPDNLATRAGDITLLFRQDIPIFFANEAWWWGPDGHRHLRTTSNVKVAMIYAGIDTVVHPDRETMASTNLLPEPRWGELEDQFPPCHPDDGGQWVLTRLLQDDVLGREETAQVITALWLKSVRDYVLEAMLDYLLDGNRQWLENIRRRLIEVTAEARDEHRGDMFRIIAIAHYLMGNGDLANAALDLAAQYGPEDRFTQIMSEVFARQVPPRWLATEMLKVLRGPDGD